MFLPLLNNDGIHAYLYFVFKYIYDTYMNVIDNDEHNIMKITIIHREISNDFDIEDRTEEKNNLHHCNQPL